MAGIPCIHQRHWRAPRSCLELPDLLHGLAARITTASTHQDPAFIDLAGNKSGEWCGCICGSMPNSLLAVADKGVSSWKTNVCTSLFF